MVHIQNENKVLARRFVDEVFNAGNRKYDQLVADDYVNHNPPVPGVPGSVSATHRGLPGAGTATPERLT